MKLLLDSNVFVFVVQEPDRIPARARNAIADPGNTRLLSLVTPWELQIKASLGQFEFRDSIRKIVDIEVNRGLVQLLPITLDHIECLAKLPAHHKDPFDRLLIAQAQVEGLTLVTSDRFVALYDVSRLWE